uniref:Uncharacterized protein n=1 Tax=Clytia hemisphaerica TaxID=252671 RepID=A0A7M5TTD3_9CNID
MEHSNNQTDETDGTRYQNSLSNTRAGVPCPLGALGPGSGNFKATCDVTNKINIDKYFELMKEEYSNPNSPTFKPPRSPRRTLGRSASSSNIEPVVLNNNSLPLSPRRKKNAKKRISCDEKSLAAMYTTRNTVPRKTESYFNYDLSGQIIPGEAHTENHTISRQKSWDLSKSKERKANNLSDDDEELSELSLSYSGGDFRKLAHKKDENNNNAAVKKSFVKSSKSCESISSLGERHKEFAMMHGKIGSVSEENRRRRRKQYRKSRKGSDERPSSMVEDSCGRINHLLMEKLVIDVG